MASSVKSQHLQPTMPVASSPCNRAFLICKTRYCLPCWWSKDHYQTYCTYPRWMARLSCLVSMKINFQRWESTVNFMSVGQLGVRRPSKLVMPWFLQVSKLLHLNLTALISVKENKNLCDLYLVVCVIEFHLVVHSLTW